MRINESDSETDSESKKIENINILKTENFHVFSKRSFIVNYTANFLVK